MKKIILFFVACSFPSGLLLADNPQWHIVSDSDYVPLTNSIKHWKEARTNWSDLYEFEYILGTDTVLGAGQGKKVYLKTYDYDTFRFIGILQENIAEKKVFFTRTGAILPGFILSPDYFPLNTPQLVYDFNVKVGDTISWKPDYYKIVGAIDSIQMSDGTWRRKIHFLGDNDYISNKDWVEGMGGLHGLFTPYVQAPNSDAFSYLLCFSEGNTLQYSQFDNVSDCQYTTTTQTPQLRHAYYPNPSNGVVHLPFLSDKNYTIAVFDISSRWIQNIQSNGNSIDLRHLNSGMYLIQVNLENRIEVFKVVIQN